MINYSNRNLPAEWGKKKLSQVVQFWDNKRVPIKEGDRQKRQGSYPYYGASGIIDYIDDYIFDEDLILLAEDGANILARSTPIAFKATGKYWVNNHAHILKPKSNADIDYLIFYLESLSYRKYNSGAAQPKLNREVCTTIPVIYPPLPEQKAIADLLSTWDDAIEKTERLIRVKEMRFKWLLRELISESNNAENGNRGNAVKLGQICKVTKGKQLNVAHMNGDGVYYALNGGIGPSGRTDDWNTEAETITISEGGNSCGYVNYNTERFWSGGHCYSLLNLKETVDKKYLYLYLKMNEPKLMKLRVGSGLPNIQKKDVDNFLVAFPPLDEQQQIADTLSSAQHEIDLLKQLANKYKTQKRGLMQKMLTGQWRIKPEIVNQYMEV